MGIIAGKPLSGKISGKNNRKKPPFCGRLSLCQLINICLHAGGAVFFHFLRHMAVNVKRKGRCGVSEIALNSFHVVAVLEGQHSVSVPKIMHTAFRRADLLRKVLVSLIKSGGDFYQTYTTNYRSGLSPDRFILALCAANMCLGPLCGYRVCCC